MSQKTNQIYSKFGANECAIVDKIQNRFIRNILIQLIGVKLKLQWSGWLQYLIPTPILVAILLIALVSYVLEGSYVAYALVLIGLLLLLKMLFDIITIKFKVRFQESRPKRKDDLSDIDLMLLRHSCRSFQTKKLNKGDFNELITSVNKHLAEPTFSKEKIRLEYISAPITVWPVVNATEFIVAIAPKKYDRYAVMDVGKTLQKVVVDATRMGIGTCWIGPGADHKSITAQLDNRFNPEKDNVICVCAVGYESKYKPLFIRVFSKRTRSRLSLDSLFFNSYKMNEAIDVNADPYNKLAPIYEACRWSPSSYNGQTTRGILIIKNNKISRLDFVAVTASRYYAAVASGIWCANWEMGCKQLEIKGRFKKLEEEQVLNQLQTDKTVPAYDMSWVFE